MNIPGCDPNASPTGLPTNIGGGGSVPCIPGMDVPGCDPKACVMPGIPYPPGCHDGTNPSPTPTNPNPTPTPTNPEPTPTPDPTDNPPPATRPDLQAAPAEVIPPVADPDLSQSYGMTKIGATEAWKTFRGTRTSSLPISIPVSTTTMKTSAFNVWRNPNPGAKNDVVGFRLRSR